jgi:hypothetical protein
MYALHFLSYHTNKYFEIQIQTCWRALFFFSLEKDLNLVFVLKILYKYLTRFYLQILLDPNQTLVFPATSHISKSNFLLTVDFGPKFDCTDFIPTLFILPVAGVRSAWRDHGERPASVRLSVRSAVEAESHLCGALRVAEAGGFQPAPAQEVLLLHLPVPGRASS